MKGLIVLASIVLFSFPSRGEQPVVVVNSSVSEAYLDKATIEKIYLGKKTSWENGSTVVPVSLKEGTTHELFLKEHVGKSSAQFTAYWNQLVFTGKGTPPRAFSSEADLVNYVVETPGAIGYVSSGTQTGKAKVVSVK